MSKQQGFDLFWYSFCSSVESCIAYDTEYVQEVKQKTDSLNLYH